MQITAPPKKRKERERSFPPAECERVAPPLSLILNGTLSFGIDWPPCAHNHTNELMHVFVFTHLRCSSSRPS